jgi:hypothetical protein
LVYLCCRQSRIECISIHSTAVHVEHLHNAGLRLSGWFACARARVCVCMCVCMCLFFAVFCLFVRLKQQKIERKTNQSNFKLKKCVCEWGWERGIYLVYIHFKQTDCLIEEVVCGCVRVKKKTNWVVLHNKDKLFF